MEDRYLFRGKCIDDGEWMSGSYYELAGRPLIFKPVFASKKAVYEIDPSTICQCTGLNDKSGRRIFENDILSGHIDVEFPEDETRKRVVWHENGWCTNGPGCDYYEELDDFDSENFEVIGNMIDNPGAVGGVTMTIDEAISHAREVAECQKMSARLIEDNAYIPESVDKEAITYGNTICANEHEQLAEWLEELKQYRAIGTVEDAIRELDEEERFYYRMSYFSIVQELFLFRTSHSGGTSTRAKCKQLGVDWSDGIEFSFGGDEERTKN